MTVGRYVPETAPFRPISSTRWSLPPAYPFYSRRARSYVDPPVTLTGKLAESKGLSPALSRVRSVCSKIVVIVLAGARLALARPGQVLGQKPIRLTARYQC